MARMWRTQDGRLLNPAEMETRHIRNALRMLKRKGFVSPNTVISYLTTLPNGDMAYDAFIREFDVVMEAPVSEFIDIFEEELRKRDEQTC